MEELKGIIQKTPEVSMNRPYTKDLVERRKILEERFRSYLIDLDILEEILKLANATS